MLYILLQCVDVGVDVVYLKIVCRGWGGCCMS